VWVIWADLSIRGQLCNNPNGEIIEIIEDKEGVIYADIEQDVKKIRDSFPLRLDRRTELYKTLF